MSTGLPIVRQISWTGAIPQLLILAGCMAVGKWLGGSNGVLIAGMAYLTCSIGSRQLIPGAHRMGIKLVRQQRFEQAIVCFQRSLEFFDRHRWLDEWRSLTMFSATAGSYREMALLNIAFCYSQLGDGARSQDYYKLCLKRFPDSGMAKAALRLIESIQEKPANDG